MVLSGIGFSGPDEYGRVQKNHYAAGVCKRTVTAWEIGLRDPLVRPSDLGRRTQYETIRSVAGKGSFRNLAIGCNSQIGFEP